MEKLDFGLPTLLELPDARGCALLAASLGFKFVELNMNLPEYSPDRLDAERLHSIAEELGVYFTLHLDENLDPFCFNPLVADAWTRTAEQSLDFAVSAGIPVVNMHLPHGVYFTLPDGKHYLYEKYADEYMEKVRAFARLAESRPGVTVCLENTRMLGFSRVAADYLLTRPGFSLTLDVGHAASVNGEDDDYFARRASRVSHMHLHDYDGKQCHLPLGSGTLDIKSYLALARRNRARVVVETKTLAALRQSAEWIRSNGE